MEISYRVSIFSYEISYTVNSFVIRNVFFLFFFILNLVYTLLDILIFLSFRLGCWFNESIWRFKLFPSILINFFFLFLSVFYFFDRSSKIQGFERRISLFNFGLCEWIAYNPRSARRDYVVETFFSRGTKILETVINRFGSRQLEECVSNKTAHYGPRPEWNSHEKDSHPC